MRPGPLPAGASAILRNRNTRNAQARHELDIAIGTPRTRRSGRRTGKRIARRNLIWSILAEHLGFSVWLMWSIVATKLPQAGFHYTTDQLFQLVALPGLIGSLMRFPYTFAVPKFGGRNWTIVSALLLLIPTLALAYFVTQPDTPFWLMLLVAGDRRPRRRQLRLQHGEHLVLLSRTARRAWRSASTRPAATSASAPCSC